MINLKEFKQSVLQKAMQGKLTKQLPSDGDAKDLLVKIANKKRDLVQEGRLRKYSRPLPPVTDKEIPSFKIPDNWEWTRLGTITNIQTGNTPRKKDKKNYISNDIQFVTPTDLKGSYIYKSKRFISKYAYNKARIALPNSIFVCGIGNVGKTGIATRKSAFNQQIHNINGFNKLLNLYILCWLQSDVARNQMKLSGTVVSIINKTKFSNFIVPLPPLSEQKRIVAKVHKCFELADTIQKERELNKKFAHDMKQSLLQQAMEGDLTKQLPSDGTADELLEQIKQNKQGLIKVGKIKKHKPLPAISKDEIPFGIPKNWKWVRLQNICDYVQKGKSPKYSNTGIPILNQRCVQWSGIKFSNHKDISLDVFRTFSHNRLLRYGDILWNTTGTGTLGRLSIVTKKLLDTHRRIVVNGDVMVVRTDTKIVSEFIHYFLSSFTIQRYLKYLITGSTNQIHLNLSAVLPLLIPLPPIKEQKRIVQKLHKLFSVLSIGVLNNE